MSDVEFVPVNEFPHYVAGTDGKIYTTKSGVPCALKPSKRTHAHYLGVNFSDGKIRKSVYVHRVICECFHGPPKSGQEVSHEDGNIMNNKPENLKWRTRLENNRLKFIHGTHDNGHMNSRAKLTKEQVYEMRRHINEGKMTGTEIGKLFGVDRTFVSNIKRRARYART